MGTATTYVRSKDGKEYTASDIIERSREFKAVGSYRADAVTMEGLKYFAESDSIYADMARNELDFWNDSNAVEKNYALYGEVNGGKTESQTIVKDAPKAPVDAGKVYSAETNVETYYNTQKDLYDQYLSSAYGASATARKEAERVAEENRKVGVKNAYVTYDRSLNTYGRNAEALAQNGLTNSGYSDYLGGVAYSNMIGNVNVANQTADEALRKAAYEEKQANAEALSAYNSAMYDLNKTKADMELAYGNRLNAAQEKALAGGFGDNADISAIAKAYQISEADAAKLFETNNTAYENVLAENTAVLEALLAGEDDGAGGKTFATDEAIRAAAQKLGITNEAKISEYIATKNKNENDYKNEQKTSQLLEGIKTSESAETDQLTEIEANKNNMSPDEYQQAYFYNALNLIDAVAAGNVSVATVEESLERWKNGKQLNPTDYANLTEYLNNISKVSADAEKVKTKGGFWNILKANFVLNSDLGRIVEIAHFVFEGSSIWNNRRNVTIDGEKYTVDIVDSYTPTEEEKQLIEDIAGNGDAVRIGDDYYVKHSRTGEWAKVKEEGTDAEFFTAFNSRAKTPKIFQRPSHTPTNP